jgi:hypothetical protein
MITRLLNTLELVCNINKKIGKNECCQALA